MKILLKSATIIDKSSPFHNSIQDIFIEDGIIRRIENCIDDITADEIVRNCYVSQGWVDTSVSFGEPGYEYNETIERGMKTAAQSGFVQVMLNPNTYPVADTKSVVTFLKNTSQNSINELYPIGALTTQSKGEYLAELYDMKQAGAVAFGDYKKTISNANLLKIALQYTQNFGGILVSFANDKTIAGKGVVNESVTSTQLGLKGIPALSEELIVARDLAILEYTGGFLHIPTISSAKSVEMVREAKAKGLDVTCSVSAYNLHIPDQVLIGFDTNYKLLPPLRDMFHIQSLIEGVKDGTIDFVTSDHCPVHIEGKQIEFDLADYGTIGLEAVFGVVNQYFSVEKSVELLTNAKKRFGLAQYPIRVGERASLTIFNTDKEYIFEEKHIISSSKNCAFVGTKLKGQPLGIIANDNIILNQNFQNE